MSRGASPVVVRRGEIWLVAPDPTIGSEIQKTRPCLVISPGDLHDHLRTVTLAPMTTGSRPAPYRIPVAFRGKSGFVLLDQLRTVDKQRLRRRLGAVERDTLGLTLTTLREMFKE